jgi:NAD(P)-dependent dehydrogenase (short-subunit alcohol dehydrogenase family)
VDIAGRVAVVTGAGAGIGEGVARRLGECGAALIAADVDDQTGAATADAVRAAGGRAEFVHADVSQEADARSMVDAATDAFGGLDILVNNAGIATTPAFPEADAEDWMRVVDINLRGVMLGTFYAIAAMRDRAGGAIVNIASLAGLGRGPHASPDYAATKAAVVRLSTALAPLATSRAIRVNCVCPDWVDTPMSRRTRARMSVEDRAIAVPSAMLSPSDIADAVIELITDDSLVGRVMCCWCGRPRSLLPVDGRE